MAATTDPRAEHPAITIEYKTGETETRPFATPADAEAFWEDLIEDGGALALIRCAVRTVPKKTGGYVTRAYWGRTPPLWGASAGGLAPPRRLPPAARMARPPRSGNPGSS